LFGSLIVPSPSAPCRWSRGAVVRETTGDLGAHGNAQELEPRRDRFGDRGHKKHTFELKKLLFRFSNGRCTQQDVQKEDQ
jgi:hypothetical protein